jgi:hypothetical protein
LSDRPGGAQGRNDKVKGALYPAAAGSSEFRSEKKGTERLFIIAPALLENVSDGLNGGARRIIGNKMPAKLQGDEIRRGGMLR